jgi:hypothetical protein
MTCQAKPTNELSAYDGSTIAPSGSNAMSGPDKGQQTAGQQAWIIRKTFIELESDHSEDEGGGKRSHSDHEGLTNLRSTSSKSSSGDTCPEGKLRDLQQWHKTWASSSDQTGSSHQNITEWRARNPDGPDGGLNSSICAQPHQTWHSSSDDMSSHSKEEARATFCMQNALDLHQELSEIVDAGADVRDVIETSYSHLDISKFVCRGQNGELLSIGSVRHLLDPAGTLCKPCGCFRRGKCYRGEKCLYCHFYHSRKDSRLCGKTKKHSVSSAKDRRDRRKRCANKSAKARSSDCGSDEEAYDSDDNECDEAQQVQNDLRFPSSSSKGYAPQLPCRAHQEGLNQDHRYKLSL